MSNHLGAYLRSLRDARGYAMRQVATLAECNHSYIARAEAGSRKPGLNVLWRLVRVLDGDFGEALLLLCLDAGVPAEVAQAATQQVGTG